MTVPMIALPPSIQLVEPTPGYPVLEINHPNCRAAVALHGAHVMSWKPSGASEDALYLSPDAIFKEGKAIRGGIPICWPWFNAHPSDPSKPSHGLVRNRFWQLVSAEEEASLVRLKLTIDCSPWRAAITIRLGKTLEIDLRSENSGDQPVMISGALHSYLRVGDIDQVHIDGLDEHAYLDTVGPLTRRQQSGPITIDREIDRIYDSSEPLRIVDRALGRTILIEKRGSPSTVIWNPWIEKAAALSDLPDQAYRHFICAETAISNQKAQLLHPGKSLNICSLISVEQHH